jgi:peptide deformylase
MTILPIRQLGDPVLREVARPVERFDDALARLAGDMLETMYDAPGVGLAAPQIGVSLRLIVFDDGDGQGGRVLVNPQVENLMGEQVLDEGCLSVRGPYAETARAVHLHVRGSSLTGEPVGFPAEGLLARIMQHEADHLDGKLFIDRISVEARREVMRQLREQEIGGGPQGPGRARSDRSG